MVFSVKDYTCRMGAVPVGYESERRYGNQLVSTPFGFSTNTNLFNKEFKESAIFLAVRNASATLQVYVLL